MKNAFLLTLIPSTLTLNVEPLMNQSKNPAANIETAAGQCTQCSNFKG